MGLRIVVAIVAFFVGSFGSTILLYPVIGAIGPTASFVLGIGLAIYTLTQNVAAWPGVRQAVQWFETFQRHQAASEKSRQDREAQRRAVAVSNPTIKIFGEDVERPEFFRKIYAKGAKPFSVQVYWENRDDRIIQGQFTVEGYDELTQRRMLESLLESARFLRAERGYPITDRLNNVNWPDIYPEGILIEIVDNDDGTRSAILAVGAQNSISKRDWARAAANGFGKFRSAWDEAPYQKATVEVDSGRRIKKDSRIMPIFNLLLKEIVIPADPSVEALGESVAIDLPHDLPL